MTDTRTPRHFLDLRDFDPDTLRAILDRAATLKAEHKWGWEKNNPPLRGKILALIFERNSTRTRVSFEVGMREMGGEVIVLAKDDLQVSRGETIEDTARVLSRYVDAVMLRTDDHKRLLTLAGYSSVPVINGLTQESHPCQVMADILTFEEWRGPVRGRTLAWLGDGNNMAQSLIAAAAQFGFSMRLACPAQFQPDATVVTWARERGATIDLCDTPQEAVRGADAVVTDTWVSMSQEGEACEKRVAILKPYQVTRELMAQANPDAIFLHCLPAHRGQEVTADVMDGPNSAVWDEAENRLHAQKAILEWCLS